ncbi:hypothetical protein C5S29_01350 [ANME-1 cluster archaeon GoMg3.2]|nr:hypothetical protein [ANME-1 cluster archaeon GoMg3.2]
MLLVDIYQLERRAGGSIYLYRRKEMATNPIQPIKAERISTATIREDLRDNILAFRLSPLQQ